jgi:hypothetical protein
MYETYIGRSGILWAGRVPTTGETDPDNMRGVMSSDYCFEAVLWQGILSEIE